MGNSSPLRKTIRDDDLDGMISLLEEAGEGSPDIINEDFTADCLIQRSRNIQSPLHTCVARRKLKMTETLIKYGADVNLAGRSGMSPLHYSAKNGDVVTCKLLVEHGADCALQDRLGEIPLHAAAASPFSERKECDDVLRFLVEEAGNAVDVNAASTDGRTPLHIASRWGYVFIAKWLLEHGADREAEDNLGKTPLDDARKRRREDMIKLLSAK